MNKLKNDKLLNALCLNDNDNILITLKNINSGIVLNKYGIKIESPALSGQKIAKIDIKKEAEPNQPLSVKHKLTLGRKLFVNTFKIFF